MPDFSEAPRRPRPSRIRLTLLLLVILHICACCLSLVFISQHYAYQHFYTFDAARVATALLNIAPLAVAALFFAFSRFSFGYFVGFNLATMILGYLWLAPFSTLNYDHRLASISAVVSLLAFLAPALFITAPLKQRIVLSEPAFERLLSGILILGAVTVAIGASYNFRIVSVADIYDYRNQLDFPRPLLYANGLFSNALLPFAFAGFLVRGRRWQAGTALLLLLSFYPITLSKLALFGPAWLAFLALLGGLFEARIAAVLSLFLAILFGVLLLPFVKYGAISLDHAMNYIGNINYRMIAVPSIAFDLYNDFFSKHDLTYFCQIGILKRFVSCPYSDYLSIVMSRNYQLGFVNASLFATEGIASVGPYFAPIAVFACGLVIALGNRLSCGLPPRFILLSGGLLSQVLMNIPLATSLLTNGAAVVFLLWYITPRAFFAKPAATEAT
ncbi:hypothetical protein [Bradyrhizobium sp.]|uniref:hypothetical protein n=1 Tax=Bradyrhizobium sp. TaxID=376 RepID=UPI003C3B1146